MRTWISVLCVLKEFCLLVGVCVCVRVVCCFVCVFFFIIMYLWNKLLGLLFYLVFLLVWACTRSICQFFYWLLSALYCVVAFFYKKKKKFATAIKPFVVFVKECIEKHCLVQALAWGVFFCVCAGIMCNIRASFIRWNSTVIFFLFLKDCIDTRALTTTYYYIFFCVLSLSLLLSTKAW